MADENICGVCGADNKPNAERCASCGAKIMHLVAELSQAELHARRHQQDSFQWRWVSISFVLLLLMSAVAFLVLPAVIGAYDPQGFPGIVIVIALWFIGAAAINFISTDKTFLEPPVGGILAAFPTMWFLSSIADVYQLSMMAYVIGGSMAVMMALMGAFVGNVLRGDQEPRPRRSSRRPSAKPKRA